MISGQLGPWFAKPDDAQYPCGRDGGSCEFAHAITAGKFEMRTPQFVSPNPFLYYIYRPHIRMGRTLFDDMESVILVSEGRRCGFGGRHFDPQNQCAQGRRGAPVN